MEIQLKELIEQIKKNGVEQADIKAASIVEAANAEAVKIIADAKAEAESIIKKAKEENDRLTKVSEDAIRQAGRNLLLSFRESVNRELDAIVNAKVDEAYSAEKLPWLIADVVKAWSENPDTDELAVILAPADLSTLEGAVKAALKARMLSGVTLKSSSGIDGGFRIAVNNGSAYYDYSAEAVTEMLSAYLSPRVSALMKEASAK